MEGKGVTTVKGWWANTEAWLGEASTDAITVAICFVSSFAIGFLFKKYLKFIFLSLIFCFLLIKGLEYYKILDIDWQALNAMLGFEPTETIAGISGKIFEWIKVHIVVTIASTLGFLIGYKLG